jgi:two-component system, NtrC family, response regulator AtoC
MELQRNNLAKKNEISYEPLLSLQERQREFVLFNKVQGALRHVPNFIETCKAILDAVMDEMDAENCSLMLKDPISNELFIRAARGKHESKTVYYPERVKNGRRFKPGEGIAGWVLEKGQAVLLNDVREESRFVRANGLHDHVRSLICVPIREKDQVVGVFNLSHSRRGAFSDGDKLILGYISNQVGAALTSARFFLECQEINRLMKDSGSNPITQECVKLAEPHSSTFIEVGEMASENGIFIYASERMHRIKEMIDQVANTDVTVFIQGESGVGKEVVARSIHRNSRRKDKPFVKVNCAAIPQELLESELFGYERGAFTGAYRQKPGKFELANGGTIFLDEIVEIPPSLQAKLLQVLQDKEFSRLGGKKDVRVDVRVIAATNKNIEESVKNGLFREDLYYRMNVVNIHVPALRERKEEIPIFLEYFLDKFRTKYNKKVKPLSEQVMKIFLEHHWTGNVRELENMVHRYVVLGNEEELIEEFVPVMEVEKEQTKGKKDAHLSQKVRPSLKEIQREAILKVECEVISKILNQTNWNRKKSAGLLNISYKALLYKIKGYGIQRHTASF